jgi:tRNA pseudouridine55 synthase
MKNGIVVINKSSGMTSHDVVSCIRRKFKMRRVGHAGTLDPLATGVLVILLGPATKLFNKFVSFDKVYEATLRLGLETDTADIQGHILRQRPYDHVTRPQIEEIFQKFLGDIQQIPPMVSAVKINGKRLYTLARKGIEVERQPRRVRIDTIRLIEFESPEVKFYLKCSKGTYVRQLAEDIGQALGCGACISQIERIGVGPFGIQEAVSLEDLRESHIMAWES